MYFEVVHWLHLPPQGYLQLLLSPHPAVWSWRTPTPGQEQTPPPFGHILSPLPGMSFFWGQAHHSPRPSSNATSSGKPSLHPCGFQTSLSETQSQETDFTLQCSRCLAETKVSENSIQTSCGECNLIYFILLSHFKKCCLPPYNGFHDSLREATFV